MRNHGLELWRGADQYLHPAGVRHLLRRGNRDAEMLRRQFGDWSYPGLIGSGNNKCFGGGHGYDATPVARLVTTRFQSWQDGTMPGIRVHNTSG